MAQQSTFGRLLQDARETAGIGRAEIAKRASLDSSHVYRLEVGGRRPSREAVIVLAECLGLAADRINEWLLAAGYAPTSHATSSVSIVRTRGGGPAPRVKGLLTADWRAEHWAVALEALGLKESEIRSLLHVLQSARPRDRKEASRVFQAALSSITVSITAPVRVAVIPMAGGQHRLLAPHVMQRLILRMIGEAAEAGILRTVLVLAPGTADQLHIPLKECLTLAIIPHIQLDCVEQPNPEGLGDAVLRAEKLIEGDPFAVLLPDDMIQDRTGGTLFPKILRRMMTAYDAQGGSHMLAVTAVPRSKMPQCGVVQLEPHEVSAGVSSVQRLVEKPEPTHPICRAHRVFGIVGRYLLKPEILDELHRIQAQSARPLQLADALQSLLSAGSPVFSCILDANRRDVGEALGQAGTLIEG